MDTTTGDAMGDFLRSRRARLTPAQAGLPAGQRRRTPGLRREEVAELAGISTDWYVRIEQGRSVQPSAATLDALAGALRLNKAERSHLHALARPAEQTRWARETVPQTLRHVVAGLRQPAYVTGRRWDLLAWNTAAARLFEDLDQAAEEERNILLFMFTHPAARRLFADSWEAEARRMLALFRTTYDLYARDPAFQELLARLRRGSREFSRWWQTHDVQPAGSGRKYLRTMGEKTLAFEYATFQSNDDPALKLSIYSVLRLRGEPLTRAQRNLRTARRAAPTGRSTTPRKHGGK